MDLSTAVEARKWAERLAYNRAQFDLFDAATRVPRLTGDQLAAYWQIVARSLAGSQGVLGVQSPAALFFPLDEQTSETPVSLVARLLASFMQRRAILTADDQLVWETSEAWSQRVIQRGHDIGALVYWSKGEILELTDQLMERADRSKYVGAIVAGAQKGICHA